MNKGIIILSEKLKALGHPLRLTIVKGLIEHESENCNVSKMSERLKVAQPIVSQHLSILRKAGIIEAKKDGVSTCYKIIDKKIKNFLAG